MEKKIHINFEARYFTHGNPHAEILIMALHGYGQLGSYFIQKFESLDPEKYFVVVPEGLHRFYLTGTSGRVGASWMTKENRESDIANYLHYLETVLNDILSTGKFRKKIILGFSQGGATASRFIAASKENFDAAVLWAAVFPPDLEPENFQKKPAQKNFLVIGNEDPYYTGEDFVNEQEKLSKAGIKFDLIKFKGKHTVESETLETILNEI
ncbi:MAG: dienelactone hydrolase family protein [Crocinitomicaceae bacterium]|nr:dienelactone hydrolase family protein [Crocinitomicaceae bacterium]